MPAEGLDSWDVEKAESTRINYSRSESQNQRTSVRLEGFIESV